MAGAYEALPVLYATLRVASAAPASQGMALVLLVLATARARGQKSRCATTLALPVCLAAVRHACSQNVYPFASLSQPHAVQAAWFLA